MDPDENSPDVLWQQQVATLEDRINKSTDQLSDIDKKIAQKSAELAAAQKNFLDQEEFIKEKQKDLTKKLEKEVFGTDGGLTAQIYNLRGEGAELEDAASKAVELNTHPELYQKYQPDIYSRAGKASYEGSSNSLDQLVSEWFESIKSSGQRAFDRSLFGQEETRSISARDPDAFASGDWNRIAELYRTESVWRNNAANKITEELKSLAQDNSEWNLAQPDGSKLEQLKAEKAEAERQKLEIRNQTKNAAQQKNLLSGRIKRYREIYEQELKKLSGTGAAPEWNEFKARGYALAELLAEEEAEKKKKEQEAQQQMPAMGPPERLNVPQQTTVAPAPKQKRAKWTPAPEGGPETLSAPESLAEMGAPESLTWTPKEFLRHPIQFFEQKIGEGKKWVSGLFAKKTTTTAVENIAGAAVSTEAKDIVKKIGIRTVVKLGLAKAVGAVSGFFSAGLGWVITALSSKTVRKALAYATTGIGLGLVFLYNFLFSSFWVSAGTIVGGIVGMFTPLTPIGGALAGAGFMHIAEGAVAEVAGGVGSWLSGVGSTAATATATTTSAVGGFLVTTTSTAAGLGATLSAVTASSVGLLSVGVAASTLVLVSIFQDKFIREPAFAITPPPANAVKTEGKLFSLEKVADVNSAKVGQVINYSLTITAGDTDIKVTAITDDHYFGSLTAPDIPKNSSQTIKYSYTVLSTDDNKTVKNTASVTANGETLTASVSVGIGSSSSCQIAPAGNECAPDKLAGYFETKYLDNASRICYQESRGHLDSTNDMCDPAKNISPELQRGYSVGLFQINLWAHSGLKNGKQDPNGLCQKVLPKDANGNLQNPFNKPFYAGCKFPNCTPCDRNDQLLLECKQFYIEADANKTYAKQLSDSGRTFSQWEAGPYCGIP